MVFHHKDERKRPGTGNHEPQAIPKPIHNVLTVCEDGEVNENAYWTLSITHHKF